MVVEVQTFSSKVIPWQRFSINGQDVPDVDNTLSTS